MNPLLVDIGNSRVKWRCGDQHGVSGVDHLATAWSDLTPAAVFAADVRHGAAADALISVCRDSWQLEPIFAATETEACGVRCAYATPETLGVDRWLALIAGFHAHGACSVADVGTALTVDAVARDGRHLGGLIAAGPELGCAAVVGRAQGVFVAPEETPIAWLATSTPAAIRSGSTLACAALIDRFHSEVEARLGPCPLLLTGGAAAAIAPHLSQTSGMRETLVLDGLAIWAQERGQ